MQATLQLLCQNRLSHLQIYFLPAQKGCAFIQHPAKGSTSIELGARVVPSEGIRAGVTSVTFNTRIPEHTSEGCQALRPYDDGALSTVKLLPSCKELLLQLNNHYRRGNQRGNRGLKPVNKQRSMSRRRSEPRQMLTQGDSPSQR
jgi:hypothetical protein